MKRKLIVATLVLCLLCSLLACMVTAYAAYRKYQDYRWEQRRYELHQMSA